MSLRHSTRSGGRRYLSALLVAAILLLTIGTAVGAKPGADVWTRLDPAESAARTAVPPRLRPTSFALFAFDAGRFGTAVAAAANETARQYLEPEHEILLPTPAGELARFRIIESPVMEPELAARFPELKSYRGVGITDPSANLRLAVSPHGCHGQVLSPAGSYSIDPYREGDAVEHVCYFRDDLPYDGVGDRDLADLKKTGGSRFCCNVRHYKDPEDVAVAPAPGTANRTGDTLRLFRLAIAATGEYTQYHGGSVADGLAALNALVTRVTGVYEVELACRLTLVANNDQIVYTNPSTDPYGADPLDDVQADIDGKIGNANYDIGHVVSTGSGGVAFLGSVCVDGIKAGGFTGLSNPVGDPFWIDYVAHEMGHQFGANHTFNAASGSCSGNRASSAAYEPGAGSTIMGYAGICGSVDNYQNASDAYFHSRSYEEINAHLDSLPPGKPATSATGNTIPQNVDAGSDFTIPKQTPFSLTASASDPDGDTLTYCWEQRDLGPAQSINEPDNGSSPLFRSFTPSLSPTRTFPRLADLLQNTSEPEERLPVLGRNMDFRVTVRDNRAGGGGVDIDDMVVTVDPSSGPFTVTSPNSSLTWLSGTRTVTWDVANTSSAPVGAANVSILLSTDGGNTFPTTLLASTPNDGSQAVTIPPIATTTARIMVRAVGNVFFDVSNANFTIDAPASPSLSINDIAVTEGDAGSLTANVTVSLSPANPTQTATVDYTTTDGSATAESDYQGTSGTLTFLPNQTSKTIPLTILGDTLSEGDETFFVDLSGEQNAILSDARGVVTIEDNELPPPVITSSLSQVATVGSPFSYQIVATNSPTSYSLTGTLPGGLGFNPVSGIISGTPTTEESATVTISASNAAGSDVESLAIQVISDPLATAVDQASLAFTTSGPAAWFRQTTTTHDGVDAARSGDVGDGETTILETVVTGPETVAFWWKVSSEADYDFLQFLVDGAVAREISGEVDWTQVSVPVPAGVHTLRWQFTKDGSVSDGSDAGWVDEVVIASSSPLPLISSPAVAYAAQGQPFSFQVAATNAPTGFAATGLPGGLGIDSSTGVISGTPTQSGDFTASINATNASGSSGGSLLIRVGSISTSLADAIDRPGETVFTGGDLPFVRTTSTSHDGSDSARTGAIGDNGRSWMAIVVEGPGDLSFWWRASTEIFYDPLSYSIDGSEIDRISGEVGWTQVTRSLGPGTHAVEWEFSRDGSAGGGSNLGWVDEVTFTSTLTPFEIWIGGFPVADDTLSGDPDHDGLVNLIEYAFDLDPGAFDVSSLPQVSLNPQGQLEVTYDRLRPELIYRVQGSTDLVNWSTSGITVTDLGGGMERATDTESTTTEDRRFIRFEIVAP